MSSRRPPHRAKASRKPPHAHGLLIRGRTILESLLPGLAEDLCAAGAVAIDVGREFGWYHTGGWSIQHESELVFLSASRALLESSIGERVRARRNIRVLDGLRAEGLKSDPDGVVKGRPRQRAWQTSGQRGDCCRSGDRRNRPRQRHATASSGAGLRG